MIYISVVSNKLCMLHCPFAYDTYRAYIFALHIYVDFYLHKYNSMVRSDALMNGALLNSLQAALNNNTLTDKVVSDVVIIHKIQAQAHSWLQC